MMHPCLAALIELLYPEECLHCGARRGETPWRKPGPLVPGLRWFDGSHLCGECAHVVVPRVEQGVLPETSVPVFAGCRTRSSVVELLTQWKYHGVRGLAWPLADLVAAAVAAACESAGPVDCLVAVPLHRRRRRLRGFNQAEVLARLIPGGRPVRTDILRRGRSTGQQAKLTSDHERRANVADAFVACPVQGAPRVGLVDDLVTGGATGDAAARALAAAGWKVAWMAALGLALRRTTGPDSLVDTDGAPT